MKRTISIFLCILSLVLAQAQPPARRAAQQAAAQKQKSQVTPPVSLRAQLDFPVQAEIPGDVVWRRDLYRSLDLTLDANAPLYYPLEPKGDFQNLFAYLFKLVLRGQIKAYEYRLDGDEHFDEASVVKGKEILNRYHIFYETKDGRMHISDSDLPSAEVTCYYLKESSYYDQRTASYHTQVTALCPVMKRAGEFGGESTPYPMFWVRYDEVAPFLAKLPLLSSNLNNASTLSCDDYFTMGLYKGTVYKTTNLQGKVIANYAPTDSLRRKEEQRIEQQMADFERHIWGSDTLAAVAEKGVADTLAVALKTKRVPRSKAEREKVTQVRRSSEKKAQRSYSSAAPRVSVRRARH